MAGLFIPSSLIPHSRNGGRRPSPVFCLLRSACPSAITRLVAKFDVNSVNCIFAFWTRPHIGKKISKRSIPSFANRYAAATVIPVISNFWVIAALPHANPTNVFGHFLTVCGMAFQRVRSAARTAAASAFAIFKRLCLKNSNGAAITSALNGNFSKLPSGFRYDRPTAKFLTNDRNVIMRFICVCHAVIIPQIYGNYQA